MNFATTWVPTIDWFEALTLLVGLVGLVIGVVCVRSGWAEYKWGLRDHRVSMRNLGGVQLAVAAGLLCQAVIVVEVTLAQFLVPSAVSSEAAETVDTVVALNVRLAFLGLVLLTIGICLALNWYRSSAVELRELDPAREASPEIMLEAAGTTTLPGGETLPVVASPVVVVPGGPPGATSPPAPPAGGDPSETGTYPVYPPPPSETGAYPTYPSAPPPPPGQGGR